MARNINSITISGVVGSAEVRNIGDSELLDFSVAVNESKKINDNWTNITHWFKCQKWKPSGHEKENIVKGKRCTVHGSVITSENDGKKYWGVRVKELDYEFNNYAKPEVSNDVSF